MEFKGNEGLTELKVSYITEMINPVELVKDLTFDEVLTDADKMDMPVSYTHLTLPTNSRV